MSIDLTKSTTTAPPTPEWLATPERFDAFVSAFAHCTLPAPEFTHAAHIAVAAAIIHASPNTALDIIRTSIRHFNTSIGGHNTDTAGYHETITRLWFVLIGRLLSSTKPASAFNAAQLAVHTFGHQRDIFKSYYSYDIIASTEARRAWIAPDLIGPAGTIE